MSKSKNSEKESCADIDVERALCEAMNAHGWYLPITPDAVARAEQELAQADLPLPSSLREPPFGRTAIEPKAEFPVVSVVSEVRENLACAAREGKTVPPEIAERMRVDRMAAEQSQNG